MNKYAEWITNIIITLFLVFVALILTILIVYIVNDSFEEQDTILAGCIGFVGAVLGGLITLIGVKLSIKASYDGIKTTIEYQNKEKVKETIGQKYNNFYQVKKIIYKLDNMLSNRKYGWNEKADKEEPEIINDAIYTYIFPVYNNLLEISASVDWEFYKEIKNFVETARPLTYSFTDEGLDTLTEIVDVLTETVEVKHEKRLSEKFEKASI